MTTHTAGETCVSAQALRRLAAGFGEQACWFVRKQDAENAAWAAALAAHYARLALERTQEER